MRRLLGPRGSDRGDDAVPGGGAARRGRSSAARAAPASPTTRRCRDVVDDRQRRVGRRRARPRLVVAHRLARSRVRHDGRQRRRLQGAVARASSATTTSPSSRSRGCPRTRSSRSVVEPRHRAGERVGRHQLRGARARREDRQGASGSARRIAARRSAGATARTPTRPRRRRPTASASTPRSAATSACSATRWTASCSGSTPGRRSRSTSTSAPHRRRSSTTGASISCTTTTAKSFLAALDAKTGKELWTVKRTDLGGAPRVGLVDAVRLGERRAHRDRHHRPRLRDQLRHSTARSCGG